MGSPRATRCPLYRQAQAYARQGVQLDRSTLAHWVGLAAELLRPVHARLLERLKASTSCSPTKRGRRCWTPGAGAPRRASYGPTPAMTDPGAALTRRAWPTSTRPNARRAAHRPTSRASAACCRWTATRATAPWRRMATVDLAFCWAHVAALLPQAARQGARRRSPPKRSRASRSSTPLRPRSAAACLTTGARSGAAQARRSLQRWSPGCAQPGARQPEEQARRGDPLRPEPLGGPDPLPRRRAHRDRLQYRRAGDPAAGPDQEEQPCSPVPTAAANTGRCWPPSWRPASSTAWSRRPTSPT